MGGNLERGFRIAGFFVAAFAVLYAALASGLTRETEVSWAVPFGLLPIALILAIGAWALEASDSGEEMRRDGLWALSGAIASFAVLRLAGVV